MSVNTSHKYPYCLYTEMNTHIYIYVSIFNIFNGKNTLKMLKYEILSCYCFDDFSCGFWVPDYVYIM